MLETRVPELNVEKLGEEEQEHGGLLIQVLPT
jgi:hypothetical protein